MATIRKRYNQVPHLAQDTTWESNKITINITNKRQEVSPFPAGDHKAAMNRRESIKTQDTKTQMICLVSVFNFHLTCLIFRIFWIKSHKAEVLERAKHIFMLNVMAIRAQRQAKVSKETTLLDGIDVGQPNWRVSGCGVNHSVHEGMKHN